MISLNGIDLGQYGLFVKSGGFDGLYDFPPMKESGIDWGDKNYIEAYNRTLDCQFKSKTITIDCFVSQSSWSGLKSSLNTIRELLQFDGLKMLTCESVSNKGYMVYLKKTTIANPFVYFSDGRQCADFKLIFEEIQPFNFQFSFDLRNATPPNNISITIAKSSTYTVAGDKQRYVTVYCNNEKTITNIHKEDCVVNTILTESKLYPFVVLGDIDDISTVSVNVGTNTIGLTEAAYYLRNGTVV